MQTNTFEIEKQKRKILIINSVPECLKVYTKFKPQLTKDFTNVIEQVIFGGNNNEE